MRTVCGVRFKTAGKIYDFDQAGTVLERGDKVVVETIRGIEFGKVVYCGSEVEEEDIKYELKKILRKATKDDLVQQEINLSRKPYAMKICAEKIKKHNLPMKLVDMEYTFDANKVIFYFTAEGRVDFRELARDLASHFKIRIELRQIGVRDQTKTLGGFGICGRPCCCSMHLSEFCPISIVMAKNQGLSLNPSKISGLCGRLLCCLDYEDEVYKEELKTLPKIGEIVKTPEGEGVVMKQFVLSGNLQVKIVKKNEEIFQNFDKTLIQPTGRRLNIDLNDGEEVFDDKISED